MVLTLIRSKLQDIMSNIQSSQSISLPSSAKLSKNEMGGWKWEVNHDGVVWSWYHTYPSPTVLDCNSASNCSKMDANKSLKTTEIDNNSKC